MSSPAQFESVGRNWAEFARSPAGTGPFKIVSYTPRQSVKLQRYDDYWDANRIPLLSELQLYPMPEATTRLAALRSGQVDWIEVPPPDAVPSLEGAGFEIVSNIYPHIWPWVFNLANPESPVADVRVRQALNYCINRENIVHLLNGLAAPAKGFFPPDHPQFGNPEEDYSYQPDHARNLMNEAGYSNENIANLRVMISTSGSGQMWPIPMNEYLQQNLQECYFNIDYEVVDWGTMLVAYRNEPTGSQSMGVDAINFSSPSSDISQMGRWFYGPFSTPNGSNWAHFTSDSFDEAYVEATSSFDPDLVDEYTARAHESVVDEAAWAFIVHDTNARAMSPKVKGFVSAQSWFQDLTQVYIED